jgi:hypothetical protein
LLLNKCYSFFIDFYCFIYIVILPLKILLLMFRFLPVVALLLVALVSQAQPGSGGPTPTGAPIDGGISVLLAGGAAYAVRRLRRRA